MTGAINRYQARMKVCSIIFLCMMVSDHTVSVELLSLSEAIKRIQQNDEWLDSSRYQQQALEARSRAAATYEDPKFAMSLANIPSDSFSFGQETMTQLKVEFSQRLPRGNSLKLKQQQLKQKSQQHLHQRQERQASTGVLVAKQWLDLYKIQETLQVIEKSRHLFTQLVNIAESRYSSAVDTVTQQDFIQAQLELTRLHDRVLVLRMQKQRIQAGLLNGLIASEFEKASGIEARNEPMESLLPFDLTLPRPLPRIHLKQSTWLSDSRALRGRPLLQLLEQHPKIKALDVKIMEKKTLIALAKQQFKPQWEVNASYGYREGADNIDRPDVFSIGIQIDLPFDLNKKHTQGSYAARAENAAQEAEKYIVLRQMSAELTDTQMHLQGLQQQQILYKKRLNVQLKEYAEAALAAYIHDEGDFSQVLKARIDELDANIETLSIDVEVLKVSIQWNYFFISSHSDQKITAQDFGIMAVGIMNPPCYNIACNER